jgi:hypothetical protein
MLYLHWRGVAKWGRRVIYGGAACYADATIVGATALGISGAN